MNTEIEAIAPAPSSIISACLQSQGSPKQHLTRSGRFLEPGCRNSELASIAGTLKSKGASEDQIYLALSALNTSCESHLPDAEVRKISSSISRYEVNIDGFTHDSLATLMVRKSNGNILYSAGQGFFYFDKFWKVDSEGLLTLQKLRVLVNEISAEIDQRRTLLDESEFKRLKKIVAKLKSADFMKKSLQLVKTDPNVRVDFSDFEKNKNLINLQNGTYDLQTGEFSQFNPMNRLRHILDFEYDPEAKCPLFKKFLSEILTEDQIGLILRIVGYSLLGSGKEQKFFIFHGRGKNGKSTLLQIIETILNPLMVNIQSESIIGKMEGSIRNDLARLAGKRLMVTNETRSGNVLDAPLLKQITGQDKLSARFLHQEYFEFQPVCVPIIVTNHLPVIDGSDFAMERRTCLISFDQVIQKADPNLTHNLLQERSGIFNLLLEGLADYQENGLSIPPSVKERTKSFVDRSNLMKGFFTDRLISDPKAQMRASDLFREYQSWCYENGYKAMSMNIFKDAFERETNLEQRRDGQGRYWAEIKTKPITS